MYRTRVVKQNIGKIKERVMNISMSNNTMMSPEELQTLVNRLATGANRRYGEDKYKIMVRGLSPTGWTTLKSFYDDLRVDEMEDYLEGRVNDHNNKDLGSFFQVQVTIHSE